MFGRDGHVVGRTNRALRPAGHLANSRYVMCNAAMMIMKLIMKSLIAKQILYVSISIFLIGCSNNNSPEGVYVPSYPVVFAEIDNYPSWSPDGSKMLYFHSGIEQMHDYGGYSIDPDSAGIWMMNIDGSNRQILAHSIYPANARWSKDGEKIAFSVSAQIFKANLNGDQLDTLSVTQLTNDGRNFIPSWSPDNMWIVYYTTFPFDIVLMRNDGANKIILHSGTQPDWSPKENRIAIITNVGDGRAELCTIDMFGNNLIQLTFDGFGGSCPEYSKDGSKIAFMSGLSIYIIDAAGGNLNKIFDGAIPYGLSWSPDGNKIAFVRGMADNKYIHGTIWIINIDGSDLRQLTPGFNDSILVN